MMYNFMYSDYCNWGNSPGKGCWAIYCTVGLQLQDTWVCGVSLTVEYLLRKRPLPVAREAKQTFATQKSFNSQWRCGKWLARAQKFT